MTDRANRTAPPSMSPLKFLLLPDAYDGSSLKKAIDADDRLSPETPKVLLAYFVLLRAEPWLRLKAPLVECEAQVENKLPPMEGYMPLPAELDIEDGALQAFRVVLDRLREVENEARRAQQIIHQAGYVWNPDTGHVETRTGRRPRSLLRDLVHALVRYRGATENTLELREEIAEELRTYSFFPEDFLDISKDSQLDSAVKSEIKAQRKNV